MEWLYFIGGFFSGIALLLFCIAMCKAGEDPESDD